MLTIIAYHYVRDLRSSRYPEIKGLSTDKFEGQLDYVAKHYSVCGTTDVIAALRGAPLPRNACLLTFDDGFIDHYHTVFPRLEHRGMVGSFFPPADAILNRTVRPVHKLHFIMASLRDEERMVKEVLDLIRPHRSSCCIPSDEDLWRSFAIPSRFNSAEAALTKRLLQRELPEAVRSVVVDELFSRHVSTDEKAFANELYMDSSQLRCMARHGMEIGGHGSRHVWLETLPREAQAEEIRQTVGFLAAVFGRQPSDWVMCYPYGSYNSVTVELLREAHCAVALTTRTELVSNLSHPLELGRLDTNDIPFTGDAPVADWTRKAWS